MSKYQYLSETDVKKIKDLIGIVERWEDNNSLMAYSHDDLYDHNGEVCYKFTNQIENIKKVVDYYQNNGHPYVDEFVVVRSYGSGVHFGQVISYDASTRHVILRNSRRLHKWAGFTLSAVALKGMRGDVGACVSVAVPEMLIAEVLELMPCTAAARENLTNFAVYTVDSDFDSEEE